MRLLHLAPPIDVPINRADNLLVTEPGYSFYVGKDCGIICVTDKNIIFNEGNDMSTSVSISANIPEALSKMLTRVSRAEERSKSYYVKKGLEQLLQHRLENLEDYEEAKEAHQEFVASGEKAVPFDAVFKHVK